MPATKSRTKMMYTMRSVRAPRSADRAPARARPPDCALRAPDGGGHDLLLRGLAGAELRGDPPRAHHEEPVAHAQDLGELRGDHDDPEPLAGQLAQAVVDLHLGADVHPARRLVAEEDARPGEEPLADDDLLLVAAAQGDDFLLG